VKTTMNKWESGGKMQRLWERDATLWTGDDEANWLGWLDITEYQIAHPIELRNLAKEVWSAGFKALQAIRHAAREKKRVATCLGFGPRFLHSTGQAYIRRAEFWSISASNLRRRTGASGAAAEIHIWSGQSGPSARRFPGAGRARTACAPCASRGCRCRVT
jgi:hypothetical protein